MKWTKPPIDPEAVKAIAARFGIDLLQASVLVRRGVTKASQMPYYLEADLRYLHSPFLFPDMVDLVERLQQAVEEGEKVLVFGDRDVDGITSTAIMVRTLQEMGLDPSWHVPMGDEPYGLTIDVVDQFAAADGSLIVTVDCGITNVPEIKHAQDLGIDTIVIDHHNPHDELPPAVAIINPKVGDEYPFDGLCACAVTAKVRQALAMGATELFNNSVTLLNVRPINGAVMVDAAMLDNGIEVDRVSETLVDRVGTIESTRLKNFMIGRRLLCYDEPLQRKLLASALGGRVDIFIVDIASEVAQSFPALAGRSLLQMREGSRLAKYREASPDELDVLVSLYHATAEARFPAIREAMESVVDLVALATLADMMPIVDENRTLVRAGLQKLNQDPQPGFRTLIIEQGLQGKRLTSRDISWTLGPVINAAGRMGSPDKAVQLFLTATAEERTRLAQEVLALNRRRKKSGEDAWRQVLPQAEVSLNDLGRKLIVVHEPGINRGVTGIIAGRLARAFNVPAAVITTVDGSAVGSIRSARGFVATRFLQRFEDILTKWGGHNEAAGFSLAFDQLSAFWERLHTVVPEVRLDDDGEMELVLDAELPAAYLTPKLEDLVRSFEPYGQANPELRFLATKLVVEQIDFMGKEQEHVRLLLSGGGYKWPAVFWGAAKRIPGDFALMERVDAVFEYSKNYYNGNETVQLVIIDVKRSAQQIA